MKKIEMLFYATVPSMENVGLKYVLFKITDAASVETHDWGFAYWNGIAWDEIPVPEGYTCEVVRWSNTVDPKLVLDDIRIIKI